MCSKSARAGDLVTGWALAMLLGDGHLLLDVVHGATDARQEDDFGVCALGHCLHGLEVADLHGGGAGQDVGGLAHELGALDLCAGGNDFGLACALALRSHGKRVLQLLAEDDVLDQHALDRAAPTRGRVFDDFADALRDFLAALNHVLQHARADYMAQGCLGALDECLADVGDAKGGFVG